MTTDTNTLILAHGSEVLWNCQGLLVLVRIVNTRSNFGVTDYEITPVNGAGNKWVRGGFVAKERSN